MHRALKAKEPGPGANRHEGQASKVLLGYKQKNHTDALTPYHSYGPVGF